MRIAGRERSTRNLRKRGHPSRSGLVLALDVSFWRPLERVIESSREETLAPLQCQDLQGKSDQGDRRDKNRRTVCSLRRQGSRRNRDISRLLFEQSRGTDRSTCRLPELLREWRSLVLAFNVQRLAFGVWRSTFGVWRWLGEEPPASKSNFNAFLPLGRSSYHCQTRHTILEPLSMFQSMNV